jgi:hypothetical protein
VKNSLWRRLWTCRKTDCRMSVYWNPTFAKQPCARWLCVCVCVCSCIYICICICTHTHTRVYTSTLYGKTPKVASYVLKRYSLLNCLSIHFTPCVIYLHVCMYVYIYISRYTSIFFWWCVKGGFLLFRCISLKALYCLCTALLHGPILCNRLVRLTTERQKRRRLYCNSSLK